MTTQPLQPYPTSIDNSVAGCVAALQKIAQIRQQDQTQWNGLAQQFISGRRVTRTPTASSNVLSTDNVGDFNVTSTYAYFLINNSGTNEWVRIAVGTF